MSDYSRSPSNRKRLIRARSLQVNKWGVSADYPENPSAPGNLSMARTDTQDAWLSPLRGARALASEGLPDAKIPPHLHVG
jgi:hypothetical protein